MRSSALLFLWIVGCFAPVVTAQTIPGLALDGGRQQSFTQPPEELEIIDIEVSGIDDQTVKSFIVQTSGLEIGQRVTVPFDPAFSEAIRSIFRLGNYDDVQLYEKSRTAAGVHLGIKVREVARLNEYSITGIRKGKRKDLQEKLPLLARTPVRPADVERSRQIIQEYFAEKGRPLSTVEVDRVERPDNTVDLTFTVNRGPVVEIEQLEISGLTQVRQKKIRKKLSTKEDRWWRFWKKSKYDKSKYNEDLQKLRSMLNERGFYDARVVSDSVYLDTSGKKPGMVVKLAVHEGPLYHIRNIDWEGNTVYTDEFLTQSLGFQAGDVYNSKKFEENLYANKRSTDVSSIYMNRGYMTFRLQPTVRVIEGDSLDLSFDLSEGDIFEFGRVEIAGNDKTKDHVIRRELYTVPGQTFSRDAIQESIRRLMQLNYFSQESMAAGPGIEVNEADKVVDLTYNLEETGSDQLQLSGTWGRFGLILSLGFEFNNFSAQNFFKKGAWRPLPSGDGQRLNLGVQTNGRFYQNYSIGYTEPWFRGKPTPVGFSFSYSRIGRNPFFSIGTGNLATATARVFYEKRLKWPDDKFSYLSGVRYQFTDNDGLYSEQILPVGVSQEVALQQVISRNSTDNPLFPSSGSLFRFSLDLAPPTGSFIQYHKWRLQNNWHVPLAPKLTLSLGADFGYVGSLTGDDVQFQRFIVGGSPFDTQGTFNRFFFATDIVYMRGYPSGTIGPRVGNQPKGGRVLNKFTSELRWMAIQSEQLQAAPYLFMDGANTWDSFQSYNPGELFRSAGFGMRFFLPILGMLEVAYGYNFDTFEPLSNSRGQHHRREAVAFSVHDWTRIQRMSDDARHRLICI